MDQAFVSIWLDTEDFVDPRADDAAMRLASILTELDAPSTFKIVGEKLRALERRGRDDVIDALARHDVGYHSNWHSRHPCVSEYVADAGWDEGVELILKNEGPGFEDIQRVFGRVPSCYGQGGSTWAPQTYSACVEWGIPVWLSDGPHVVVNNAPHRYCSLLNISGLGDATARVVLSEPDSLRKSEETLDQAVRFAIDSGGGVVNVFYHPCEFVSSQFWDAVNFAAGQNPAGESYELPPPLPESEIEAGFERFKDYVKYMKSRADVQIVTASFLAEAYEDVSLDQAYNRRQACSMAEAFLDEHSFVRVDRGWLSPAEVFSVVAGHVRSLTGGKAASPIKPVSPLGPKESPERVAGEATAVDDRALIEAAVALDSDLRSGKALPAVSRVGGAHLTPESLLTGLCRLLLARAEAGEFPQRLETEHVPLTTEKFVADDSTAIWDWSPHPPGFRAPHMMSLAKRQAWTIKPASPLE